ncbi:retron Ec78 anti-phage system effector ATPase PtuA [Acinetobacter johnsonii]|uniref:retron Ec78 anti-phage system effector ATPase PtuA n=1 Tax=Acinetobacter johnsonii TaxID=40214 RepID=UPI001F2EF8F9|nr:retron Ec78 anti-phage system effector ATPase PtuA [Acinetobacter johnsonii]UIP95946.1 AAA family ATPase [Acinetobacter johnsonii]
MSFKNLNNLQKNSNKGSIFSSFQLFENEYQQSPRTFNPSSSLFQDCLSYVSLVDEDECPINKLYLEKIQLKDFRKFRSSEFNFNQNLTVLIGSNGVGKSTIIESITKIISWIGNGLLKEKDNGRPVTYEDINNNSTDYAEINSYFQYGKTKFSGNISKPIKGRYSKKDSHVYDLKFFANILRSINDLQKINLPLFCYYPVERLRDSSRITPSKESENIDRYYAYKDAWDGRLKLDTFFNTFSIINNKSKLYLQDNEITSLKDKIHQLKSIKFSDMEVINFLEKQLKDLEIKNKFEISRPEMELDFKKFVEVIKNSLIGDLLGINDISFNSFSGKPQVYFHLKDGNIVNSKQLSHGQKVTFSLIGDICLRLLLLNPNLNDPLKGQGIVLIDELELHLHPSWQQKILISLRTNFPNIQFIVSTHSPQILSTIDKKYIRQLSEDSTVNEPVYQTEGSRSSDILEQVMSTFSIPNIDINNDFNYYLGLIEQDLHETDEGLNLRDKLFKHYGENHTKIKELNSLIRLRKLKNKIANKKLD